jgi:hypothetical protein
MQLNKGTKHRPTVRNSVPETSFELRNSLFHDKLTLREGDANSVLLERIPQRDHGPDSTRSKRTQGLERSPDRHGFVWRFCLSKDSRLDGRVSESLACIFSSYLSLDSATQCGGRHLVHRASAFRPLVVRKTSARRSSGLGWPRISSQHIWKPNSRPMKISAAAWRNCTKWNQGINCCPNPWTTASTELLVLRFQVTCRRSSRIAAARRCPSRPSLALWRIAGGATFSTPCQSSL